MSDMEPETGTPAETGTQAGTWADEAMPSAPPATQPTRRIDVTNLVAGLVFLAMAITFSVADLDSLDDQVRYVWPTVLLAIGLGMLVGARRR